MEKARAQEIWQRKQAAEEAERARLAKEQAVRDAKPPALRYRLGLDLPVGYVLDAVEVSGAPALAIEQMIRANTLGHPRRVLKPVWSMRLTSAR